MFRFWHCKWKIRYLNFSLQGNDKETLVAKQLSQSCSREVEPIFLIGTQDEGKRQMSLSNRRQKAKNRKLLLHMNSHLNVTGKEPVFLI